MLCRQDSKRSEGAAAGDGTILTNQHVVRGCNSYDLIDRATCFPNNGRIALLLGKHLCNT